jgi:hypothetical protein
VKRKEKKGTRERDCLLKMCGPSEWVSWRAGGVSGNGSGGGLSERAMNKGRVMRSRAGERACGFMSKRMSQRLHT